MPKSYEFDTHKRGNNTPNIKPMADVKQAKLVNTKGRNHLLAGRVDLDTYNRAKQAAEAEGVTVSTIVSRALSRGLRTA